MDPAFYGLFALAVQASAGILVIVPGVIFILRWERKAKRLITLLEERGAGL